MKTLIVLLSVLAINITVSARPPHEKSGGDWIYDMNQMGKIHTSMLNALDADIDSTQAQFDLELGSLNQTSDYVEGMIISIGSDILKVREAREALETKYEILDADVQPLHNELTQIRKVIEEINLD